MIRKYYSNGGDGGGGGGNGTSKFDEDLIRGVLGGDLNALGSDAIVFVGFLMADPRASLKAYRLFLTPEMDNYIEFEQSALVHQEQITKGAMYPLGGTIVWLKKDALVQVRRASTAEEAQSLAAFLQGNIAARFMAGAIPGINTARARAALGGSVAGCGSQAANDCGLDPTNGCPSVGCTVPNC